MEHTGSSMDMGTMNGSIYSFDGFLAGLLVLLVKFLMVALVIAIIIGIIIWIKNNFFNNTNSQFLQTLKNDPIIKIVLAITAAVLLIILVMSLIAGLTNQGMGFGAENGLMMSSYNSTISIYGILSLFIKILSFIFIISLMLAILAFIKKQYDAGLFNISKTGGTGETSKKEGTAEEINERSV